MNALKNPNIAGIAWLVVRLYVGYEWLIGGIEKVFGAGSTVWVGSRAGAAVTGFLNGAIALPCKRLGERNSQALSRDTFKQPRDILAQERLHKLRRASCMGCTDFCCKPV